MTPPALITVLHHSHWQREGSVLDDGQHTMAGLHAPEEGLAVLHLQVSTAESDWPETGMHSFIVQLLHKTACHALNQRDMLLAPTEGKHTSSVFSRPSALRNTQDSCTASQAAVMSSLSSLDFCHRPVMACLAEFC